MKKFTQMPHLISFFISLTIVGLIVYLFNAPEKELYITLQVNNGYWWFNQQAPPAWYARAINNQLASKTAKVLNVYQYPLTQFNPNTEEKRYAVPTFVKLKLKSSYNPLTHQHSYKHQNLAISQPLNIDFPTVTLTGTIISLSPTPPKTTYVPKILHLTKRYSQPWEFQAIEIGDTYSTDNLTVFKVLDKSFIPTKAITPDEYGNITAETLKTNYYLRLKVLVLAEKIQDYYFFAQTTPLIPKVKFNLTTPKFSYDDFDIEKVTDPPPNLSL